MGFQTVCRVEDLPVGQMKAAKVGGTSVVVYHLEDGFFATQSSCSHLFAPLARGRIVEGCKVQCPFHRARFDIRTGAVTEWASWPPGVVHALNFVRGEKALRTFPTRVQDGTVQVDA
jgi:nitrite reductase/ring-hydroxylating ferredoxin subunit